MSLKKQLVIFVLCCLLFASLFAFFNFIIDPFGIFGDVLFNYYEFNMTENPRLAKIAYIDKHHEEYDSYVFGCSKSSSYPIEELNEYLDADFYNMFVYGGDLHDIRLMAEYVLDNYGAKNIVLAVGPEAAYRYDSEDDDTKDNLHSKVDDTVNPLLFYSKYLFLNPTYSLNKLKSMISRSYLVDSSNVFCAETGAYNKARRDVYPISELSEYVAENGEDLYEITHARPIKYIDDAVSDIAAIKEKCQALGVNFIMIGSPMYESELACYDSDELATLYRKLTEVTDFYDFWGVNAFSNDARYFYDGYHFRNCVGSAALGYIFGGDKVYVPDNFGHFTTKENVEKRIASLYNGSESPESHSIKVPILMYHALTENADEASDTIITAEAFEKQVAALTEEGYTTLFYQDLVDYVNNGKALPEKPILITFDDGYESNLKISAPILEKYGQRATISVIGVSVGKDTYKDTGKDMYPHFSFEEAKKWYEAGVLDFQSHTYDMHNNSLDTDFRDGVLIKSEESEKEYISALREDFRKSREELEKGIGCDVFVMTYPFGKYSELSEVILSEEGVTVSVTVSSGVSEITRGLPQSLRGLKRLNMTDAVGEDELLRSLAEYIYG